MAIYHCTTKPISRANGRSATASSAYRASEKIKDLRTGEVHDYTKKQGVVYTEIINNLDESISRSQVWNTAELTETRKNSRVAREFIVALPDELNPEQRKELAKEFTQYLVNKYSVVADLAIHAPSKDGDDRNHHAHIMITTRKAVLVDGELKLTDKADLELSNAQRKDRGLCVTQDEIKGIREVWANMANRALELSGSKERIDHRSYEDQNLDLEATIHEGPKVTQLRRKGIDTEISKHNDQVKSNNENQIQSSPEDMQKMLDRANDFANSRLSEWKERKEQERQEQLKIQRQEQARIRATNRQKEKSHSVRSESIDRGFSR
ncbi:MobQ family relaxase [Wohlfahrtiimonas chitiniclastica]|uniref:MobQ family relaxase n=1 Tax=Wohlfahrtiimonas chitiniclastica TaxID=400946 RepID=UPI0007B69AF3|nr:MobQ family relaxase [Wohlfahrtiimonas chitiniclastica]KZX37247.1 mobilization protein [Wohlfahrtiimonas chitiniclastica]KZX37267.1 mobilization protein [Wohlfahrtiimonas chitiniclastica]